LRNGYIDSPLLDILIDLLFDVISDFLSFFEHILKDELPAGILEDGVGDLCDGGAEVLDPIVGIPWVDHSVVDCSVNVDRHVILCYDVLPITCVTCRARSIT
jgi:hypothetical protein